VDKAHVAAILDDVANLLELSGGNLGRLGYYLAAFALTLLLAHLSYRYFELPFLRLKDRRFASAQAAAPPATPGVPAAPAPTAAV